MSQISINNLTFAYEGSYDNIFENVSFNFDTDWKLGFVARNGRGKTTFLNLLMGKYEYKGSISATVDFEYFPYAVADPESTTLDVIDGIIPGVKFWQLQRELNLLEVQEDVLYRPYNTLSNGEQTKILLAALFLRENSFLLIDEPTNHLDMNARQAVSGYLRSKQGFILVSHDRTFLDNCVDHILSINKTNIQVQKGNFSSWLHNKALQDKFELEENERLTKDIARLAEAAKRTSAWSAKVEKTKYGPRESGLKPDKGYVGHKAAKLMKRAKAIEERQQAAAEEKAKLLKNIEYGSSLKLTSAVYHTSKLIELKDIALFYGSKKVCDNISFTVEQGDRLALLGKNGSGKSSILKLICGEQIEHTGGLYKASKLKVSYVPQDTSFLQGSLTDFARNSGIDESLFKTILRKLDFMRVQFEKDMKDFSAGQKKKVLIARSLCEQAHLYVWDEPLNFIDVISRMQIEELLLSYRPMLIFVEHDRAFCENIATKQVCL